MAEPVEGLLLELVQAVSQLVDALRVVQRGERRQQASDTNDGDSHGSSFRRVSL